MGAPLSLSLVYYLRYLCYSGRSGTNQAALALGALKAVPALAEPPCGSELPFGPYKPGYLGGQEKAFWPECSIPVSRELVNGSREFSTLHA